MKVELVPVIEIGYNNQGVPSPDKYPYWEFPVLWDKYHSDTFKKAGFIDDLRPYLAGSSFYRLSEITDDNLNKLMIDHTKDLREGKYERAQASPFFGGYVLRIDGKDKYYPQCCGDLSDINYWNNLTKRRKVGFYGGHPEPQVKINDNRITFDFRIEEFGESFIPPIQEIIIHLHIASLDVAIESAKQELKVFELRLQKINQTENLNIDNIGELLIWNDVNYL